MISAEEKRAVAAKLAAYTGTRADYWEKADLRVSHTQFLQELHARPAPDGRPHRLALRRPGHEPARRAMNYDPFFPAVGPAYTAAFLDYLHNELEFGRDEDYRVSAFDVKWDWKHKQPGTDEWFSPAPNTVPDLARALTMNPGLHVLVQQGWYDLATPQFIMKHDLDHLRITPEARERIRVEYYEAGHMMYLHAPSMRKYPRRPRGIHPRDGPGLRPGITRTRARRPAARASSSATTTVSLRSRRVAGASPMPASRSRRRCGLARAGHEPQALPRAIERRQRQRHAA